MKYEKPLKRYFDEYKLNDEVFSTYYGKGIISGFHIDGNEYEIICSFDCGSSNEYNLEGKTKNDKEQTLFYLDTQKHGKGIGWW